MQRKLARISFLLFLAGALQGCALFARKPSPLIRPDAKVSVAQFAGTALSGPTSQTVDYTGKVWSVSARIVAVKTLPQDSSLVPIGPLARLVISPDPSLLFSPSSRLVYSMRIHFSPSGSIEHLLGPADQRVDMGVLRGAVAPGSTVSFEVALPDNAPVNQNFPRRKLSIAMDRVAGHDGYELVVISDDLLLPRMDIGQEKLVLQQEMPAGTEHLVLTTPMTFANSQASGLIIELNIDAQGRVIRKWRRCGKRSGAASDAAGRRMSAAMESSNDATINAALGVIAAGHIQRGTLIYLADATGAKLTSTVVLASDDKALGLIWEQVRAGAAKLVSHDRATVAWMLDQATIKAISSIKPEDSPTTLTPIMGALSAFAGEAGRQIDVLQSLASQSTGSDDLYNRIIAEQYIALEDNSPSVRVRAWDWLVVHAKPPPGFDPLGSPRQRRDALDRFDEASTSKD